MRSGYERKVAQYLDRDGVDYDYEHITYGIIVPVRGKNQYCADCQGNVILRDTVYTPDFFLGNGVVVESKGRFTAKDRLIAIAMKEQHPDVDLRILFMSNNKISPASKTRYVDWCDKKGIKYAVSKSGELPKEWLV